MGMTLPEYRALLQVDLKSASAWSSAELDRSVQRAVSDLSRFLPLEKIVELSPSYTVTDESFTTPATASATAIVNAQTLNGVSSGGALTIADNTPDVPRRLTVTLTDANASVTDLTIIVKGYDQDGLYIEERWTLHQLQGGTAVQGKLYFKRVVQVEVDNIAGTAAVADTLSVGTGNAYDSYIFLANKPIRPGSVTLTSSPAGTTYTIDTDYTIDYINGAVKFINGGSMAAGTAYLIDYTKSRLGINISSLIPTMIRIQRVEYPHDLVPQKFVSFSLWGDFLYITSKGANKSQEELTTATTDHMVIYYETVHTPPGEGSPGSYPELLDEVVCIGAQAYALFIEALQYELQAESDVTLMNTALTNAIKYLNNNSAADMAGILQDITDDAANLRTAIATAVNAANAYLDEVDTTDLGQATVGAEGLLETGDDKIDVLNVGAQVAENYSDYSRSRVNVANARTAAAIGYVQEAQTRLNNLTTYLQQAEGYDGLARGFLQEAQFRAEQVNADLVLSDRFRAEGLERLNEFYAILKNKAEWRRKVSIVSVNQPA